MNKANQLNALASLALTFSLFFAGTCVAQEALSKKNSSKNAAVEVHKGEMGFPEFRFPMIEGAPVLSRPMMVMGSTKPLLTEKHGLAAPAFYDWNQDGKKDLLIGEFETGDDESNIRVYLNIGTESEPRFNDEFKYAEDTKNKVISVKQW